MRLKIGKEDIQMANKKMKRCSTSLVIRGMQIEIITNYNFIPTRIEIIKMSDNYKF